jgi:hypothetical protein
MPAIASLEDLKSAQKDLLEAKDLNELKTVSEMAGNCLEEWLQALVTGTHPRTIER